MHDSSEANTSEISIHPPREGWDRRDALSANLAIVFQSTHPVRGGTFAPTNSPSFFIFQSTHPVRGGTLPLDDTLLLPVGFQSTHPVRGGTRRR